MGKPLPGEGLEAPAWEAPASLEGPAWPGWEVSAWERFCCLRPLCWRVCLKPMPGRPPAWRPCVGGPWPWWEVLPQVVGSETPAWEEARPPRRPAWRPPSTWQLSARETFYLKSRLSMQSPNQTRTQHHQGRMRQPAPSPSLRQAKFRVFEKDSLGGCQPSTVSISCLPEWTERISCLPTFCLT